MERDPLMKYFYNIRSKILKEGNVNLGSYAHIKSLQFPQDIQKLGPPPPNAKSFFIGDQHGGSGWIVQMQDGSTEKFYVDFPDDKAQVGLYLPDAPADHLGKTLNTKDIVSLGVHYFGYLEKLIQEARRVFLS